MCYLFICILSSSLPRKLSFCVVSDILVGFIHWFVSSFIDSFIQSLPEDTFIDFRERERVRAHTQERNIDVREKHPFVASYTHPHRQLDWGTNRSLGMCPDRESNPQPFGTQDDAPANWGRPARAYTTFWRNVCLYTVGGFVVMNL